MNTTAITLSSITGFLFLMAGVPKVFGVPAPMGARVRSAFERFGMPTEIRIATGAIEIAFAIGLWIAAAISTAGLAIACAAAASPEPGALVIGFTLTTTSTEATSSVPTEPVNAE